MILFQENYFFLQLQDVHKNTSHFQVMIKSRLYGILTYVNLKYLEDSSWFSGLCAGL